MIKILNSSDYREMPWKNGGGITREIFRYPETGEWDLRISMAQVDQSGPFSQFPGMMRHLVLLTGKGMKLTSGDFEVVMDRALLPLTFSGEFEINAELIDGSNTDFNVFWKKSEYTCTLQCVDQVEVQANEFEFVIMFNVVTLKSHIIENDQLTLTENGPYLVTHFKRVFAGAQRQSR